MMKRMNEKTGRDSRARWRTPAAALSALVLCVIGAAMLGAPSGAGAQDLGVPAEAQTRPVLITGATVHTVSGETLVGGGVLFADGEITGVMSAGELALFDPPANVRVVGAAGKHLYPGLVALETRLGLIETGAVRATRDENETGDATPEVYAAVAVNPDSTLIPVARAGGVLIAGVMPTGGRVPGRASVIRTDGWTWEDMTVSAQAALMLDWPTVRPSHRWYMVDTPQDQAREIRQNLSELDDLFDSAEAWAALPENARPDDARLAAMEPHVDPALDREQKKPIFVLANDLDEISSAVTWAAARGYRVTVLGGRDAPMCADLLKEHGVGVVVTGLHRLPRRDDSAYDEHFALPGRLAELGVEVSISPSDGDGNVRNLPFEAGLAVRHGMGREDALRAITLTPAEMLGVGDRYGSVEAGKSATFVLTDGDIFEVTTRIESAFIDGRAVSMENKQTELRDKFLEKYRRLGVIED